MKCSMRINRISVIYECLAVLPCIPDCERQKLDKNKEAEMLFSIVLEVPMAEEKRSEAVYIESGSGPVEENP